MAKAKKSAAHPAAKPENKGAKKPLVTVSATATRTKATKQAAGPKSVTQKQYDDLQKQLAESEAKRITAEEIMHANSGEDETRIRALEAENKRLKSEVTSVKVQKFSLEEELNQAKQKINNTYNDTKGWLERGNKWAFAAVPVIILGIWIAVVSIRNNDLHDALKKKDSVITGLEQELQVCRQGRNYDSLHDANNGIVTPDAKGDAANFSGAKR